ncbi:MAG: Zn-ribbon domain-containing OB-fold protein [Candidatus Syntropharchaeales archaeon]
MGVPRFWRAIPNRYNLIGSRCTSCGNYYYPKRVVCPHCRRRSEMTSYTFAGEGTVETFTEVYVTSTDFEREVPYIIGIVKLDEGPSLTSQIVCDPEEIDIGTRVRAIFRRIGEDGDKGIIYYGTKFTPI